MPIEVVLPSLGDDNDAVTKATVSEWLVVVDSPIGEGDDLLEIITDKAAFVVPAPAAGRVTRLCVAEGDKIAVGVVICEMEQP